jgi:glycopeptide antibiotics resistance protein
MASTRELADRPGGSAPERVPLVRPLALLLLVCWSLVVVALTWSAGSDTPFAEDNLVPLDTIGRVWDGTASPGVVAQAVGNVVLFVPVGILVRRTLPRVRGLALAALVALAAVAVECVQGVAVPGRIIDVDDAILGAFGGFLGVLLAGWRRTRPARSRGLDG